MSKHNHPFHLVDYSPWPLTGSIGALTMVSGLVMWFHKTDNKMMMLGIMILLLTMYQWWRDIIREGTYQGKHTLSVIMGLKMGMILFIVSEVLFFVSFFWAFFHSSLAPTVEIGMIWPPKGIETFNPMQIPLLNTMILLCSGISITWAHHAMMEKNHNQAMQGLIITIMLGMYFTILQGFEYIESMFTISDSVYGSCFFMATGFHGIHVCIGTLFIIVCLMRHMKFHFSSTHHFGFEAAAWYWHFVDVVWLFLYITIYWWGS
uniref:Cytochrome c oxidase subunit 3 n=1 Tax=Leucophoroptera quadrimaculata TaxID=981277 RepID=A0A514LRF0_9HEMI|nr:cytochrome c oxidase subunit III [Leucophoroptera quadrimaculata]